MQGVVDRVGVGGIAGWCLAPSIVVSVNGVDRCSALCSDPRPDVQAAGLSATGLAGFKVPLALEPGDVVRVRPMPDGSPLRHSPWLYLGDGESVWLEAPLAVSHPEYGRIARLSEVISFTQFCPLFGHAGSVVGAALRDQQGQARVARFGLTEDEVGDIRRIYERVLMPERLACPPLLHVEDQDGDVLFYGHVSGERLDSLVDCWTPQLEQVVAEVRRLHDAGTGRQAELGRRSGRKPTAASRLMARTARAMLTGRRPLWEWPRLCRMLATTRRLPRVLSHGDLHRNNVLIERDSGRAYLIDWDLWGYLPLGYDLAMLLRGLPGARIEPLVGGPRELLLGVVVFTYLLQSLVIPGFGRSEEGRYLFRRFNELTRPGRQ